LAFLQFFVLSSFVFYSAQRWCFWKSSKKIDVFFTSYIREMETTWKLDNANPSLLNSPCNPVETHDNFPVGKVNKCRGRATGKFEVCSEFCLFRAQHEVSDGFDALEYTAIRFSNSCPFIFMLATVDADRTNQILISRRISI